jgi:hypothetical protein
LADFLRISDANMRFGTPFERETRAKMGLYGQQG